MGFDYGDGDKIARALSLTGGGVRGVFTAATLSELEARMSCDLSEHFDVVVGTSVGGIIAIGLAAGISATTICEAIKSKVKSVFGNPARLNPMGLRCARYRPGPLRDCVETILGDKAGFEIRSLKKNVVVPSIDAETNEIVYFSNIASMGQTKFRNATLIDVAMATSAAPTYFPAHVIADKPYVDGGIASNNPDIEALRFCLLALARPKENCLVLSIGSGARVFAKTPDALAKRGLFHWGFTYDLPDRIMCLQEAKSSELLSELIGDHYLRLDTTFHKKIDLDDCRQETINELHQRASVEMAKAWAGYPKRLAAFVR